VLQVDDERRVPVIAGFMSCAAFLLGSLPGILPFALIDDTNRALLAASCVCGFTLFWTGACKSVIVGIPGW